MGMHGCKDSYYHVKCKLWICFRTGAYVPGVTACAGPVTVRRVPADGGDSRNVYLPGCAGQSLFAVFAAGGQAVVDLSGCFVLPGVVSCPGNRFAYAAQVGFGGVEIEV